jgi:hypothetical protein
MNDIRLAPTSVPSVSFVVKYPSAPISVPNSAHSASSAISALNSDSASLFLVFSCRLLTVICRPPLTPIIPEHTRPPGRGGYTGRLVRPRESKGTQEGGLAPQNRSGCKHRVEKPAPFGGGHTLKARETLGWPAPLSKATPGGESITVRLFPKRNCYARAMKAAAWVKCKPRLPTHLAHPP